MFLGRIEGKVWASIKDESLTGIQLSVMQPIDEFGRDEGLPVVAVDTIGATDGDIIYWVNSTEACFVRPDSPLPSEVSVVGIVDRIDLVIKESDLPD